jgi:hypothetical protein
MSARLLVEVCTALAVGAGLLWAASAVPWAPDAPGGLGAIALVALAGIAGVVATGGVLRRVVGVLLAGAGVVVAGLAVSAWTASVGPFLAVAGALVLVAAGVVVALREPRLPRLGARYAAPGRRPESLDPDRQAWVDLDEGRDPTLDGGHDGASTSGPEADPGRGDDSRG